MAELEEKEIPECCGRLMDVTMETRTFYEAECCDCGDTIFIKKNDVEKPVMLDD